MTVSYGTDVLKSNSPLGSDACGDQNGSQQPYFFLFFDVPYNTGKRVGLCQRPLQMELHPCVKPVMWLSTK